MRFFQGLFTTFIVAIAIFCTITKAELYPFAPYTMYSYSISLEHLKIFEMFAEDMDGKKHELKTLNLWPMDEARILWGIKKTYDETGTLRAGLIHEKVEGILHFLNRKSQKYKSLEVLVTKYKNVENLRLKRVDIIESCKYP